MFIEEFAHTQLYSACAHAITNQVNGEGLGSEATKTPNHRWSKWVSHHKRFLSYDYTQQCYLVPSAAPRVLSGIASVVKTSKTPLVGD